MSEISDMDTMYIRHPFPGELRFYSRNEVLLPLLKLNISIIPVTSTRKDYNKCLFFFYF